MSRHHPSLLLVLLLLGVSLAAYASDEYGEQPVATQWQTPALFGAIIDAIGSGDPVDTRENVMKYDDVSGAPATIRQVPAGEPAISPVTSSAEPACAVDGRSTEHPNGLCKPQKTSEMPETDSQPVALRQDTPLETAGKMETTVQATGSPDQNTAGDDSENTIPVLGTILDIIGSGKPVDTRENVMKYDDVSGNRVAPLAGLEASSDTPSPVAAEHPVSSSAPHMSGQATQNATPSASVNQPEPAKQTAILPVPAPHEENTRPTQPVSSATTVRPADSALAPDSLNARDASSADCEPLLKALKASGEPQTPQEATQLGLLYQSGYCVKRDPEKALQYFRFAADAGEASAMYQLGIMLATAGHGTDHEAQGTHWLRLSAEKGYVPAMTAFAIVNLHSSNTSEKIGQAVSWLEKAASLNDPDALFELGMLSRNGYASTPANPAKAASLFERAEQSGHKNAGYQLALLQFSGKGVTKDQQGAITRFTRLAQDGFAPAQYTVGYLYLKGEGLPQDPVQAKTWFEKAAAQHDIRATASLGYLYREGLGVPQNDRTAFEHFEKAARANDFWSQDQLGLMLAQGRGTEPSPEKAAVWFEKAAKSGYPPAQYHLALLLLSPNTPEKNPEKAHAWLKLSAESNHAEACHFYASILYLGIDIGQDVPKAIEYFNRAAMAGNAESMYILGTIYAGGRGTLPDREAARHWLTEALRMGHPDARAALDRLDGKENGQKANETPQSAVPGAKD